MPRLNITVPDDLYEALEKWRDRLNISKICQEAIAREVAKLEDLPRQAVELEALVERLRQEKAHVEKFYFAQGVTDGIAWARGASYVELQRCGESGRLEQPARDDRAKALEHALRRYRQDPAFDEQTYLEGWRAGVREVWRRVKDKV